MISESAYIEMMKNCSKWNSRVESERKTHFTVLDAQTGIAQRPSLHALYTFYDRYKPSAPSQYCAYTRNRWKRCKSMPASDATEMRYILSCNPAINEVINQATVMSTSESAEFSAASEVSIGDFHLPEKKSKNHFNFQDSVLDNEIEERSEDEPVDISEEEDWSEGKKRRKKRGPSGGGRVGRKSALPVNVNNAPMGTPDPKPFNCTFCGAKYKSRPGLNYHRAHVHPETQSPSNTPQPPLSTNV